MSFKVGDLVECQYVAGGDGIGKHRGVIEIITPSGLIQLETQDCCEFYLPCQCKLIERPKRMVKKKMWLTAREGAGFPLGIHGVLHTTKHAFVGRFQQ